MECSVSRNADSGTCGGDSGQRGSGVSSLRSNCLAGADGGPRRARARLPGFGGAQGTHPGSLALGLGNGGVHPLHKGVIIKVVPSLGRRIAAFGHGEMCGSVRSPYIVVPSCLNALLETPVPTMCAFVVSLSSSTRKADALAVRAAA